MSDVPEQDKPFVTTFLQRWSQRKRASHMTPHTTRAETVTLEPASSNAQDAPQVLPSIESLQADSEVSMFLRDEVSEALRRKALRKLFHMEKFNVCDGLDDYAEDYTKFQPLGDVVTAYQRLQEERQALARQLLGEDRQDEQTALRSGDDVLHTEQLADMPADEEVVDVTAIPGPSKPQEG